MTELKVSFRSNVLRLSHAEALVKLVCGIVQAFCSQGRVGAGQLDAMGVLLRGELYPVHSTCLHTWGVRYERLPNDGWTYYAPPPRRKWSILKRLTSRGGNTSDKSALLSVRLDDRRVATVTHLEAFQLRWISSTAVEVNFEPDLKRFTIGADSDLEVYREILPRICLPVLETLSVELPLPLDVLAAFLANHRSLICLRLLSSLSGSPLAPDIQPLSLPHLSTITVADSAMLPLLFGLISIGPSPKSISVTLQRPLFTEDSAMSRPVLSTLAQLRPETHLSLDLWITLASARTADIPADLLELAAHTTCIHTLVVHAHAISAVRAIVPWVSALPSLRTLELRAPEPVDDVAVATCLRFVETRVRQRNVPLTVVYMEVVSPVSLAGNATVS
ncbi:unnamed protein product [Mycena citricolor]|uniref:Uncharacterized protein n=1 Tax=Mycena citricolor TaxID=2018698 RepID=A0AAD2JWU6_9AGAR|nr:unnamed protein product [Mycena citricolor]